MPRRKLSNVKIKKMKKDTIEYLKAYLGILAPALEKAGSTYYLHNKWISEDEEYANEINEVSEGSIDFVESKLMGLIKDNDKGAIIFYLKCKAKHRGYVERQEVQQTMVEPIKIEYYIPDEVKVLPDTETGHYLEVPNK